MDTRCAWAMNHPLERDYHDKEWGVPVYDDRVLFEFITLEGAQAGLKLDYDFEKARRLPRGISKLRYRQIGQV